MKRKISNEQTWLVQPLFPFRRFYKVSFDNDYLYFSDIRPENKIALDKIVQVRTGIFPIRLWMRNAYVVTIEYLENDKVWKIRFISKGTRNFTGTNDGISFLDTLRQAIWDKKRGE